MKLYNVSPLLGIKIQTEIDNLHSEFLEKFPITDTPKMCSKERILIEFKNMFDFWWSKSRNIHDNPNKLNDEIKNNNDEINIALFINRQVEMKVIGLWDQLNNMGLKEEYKEFVKKY